MCLVDNSVKTTKEHIAERLLNGENESNVSAITSSKMSSNQLPTHLTNKTHESKRTPSKSQARSVIEIHLQEARDARESFEREQDALHQHIQEKCKTFELNKKIIEDAQSVALLNQARAEELEPMTTYEHSLVRPSLKSTHVKLEGVELPTFSGGNKTEFETWNAAFISVVDDTDIPVN